jgi:hypothetical protein
MNLDDKISRIKIALERDDATFVEMEDKSLRKTQVTFICNCGKEHKKGFLTLEKYVGSAICKECTNKNMVTKIKKTNKGRYGIEHKIIFAEAKQKSIITRQTKEYKVKISKIMKNKIEKGEIIVPKLTTEIKEKIKNTLLKKTGFTNAMQDPENKEKRKKTNLDKYGVEHAITNPIVKEKALKTMEKNTGKQYALQTDKSKDKQKETMMQKYGVEYAMHNPELAEKCLHNSYRTKEYKTPKGNIIKYQGYENHALDELLIEQNISEEEIINGASKVPIIKYPGTDGNIRRHYIDIYLPTQNKCIEVKSTYTFSLDKENILSKQKAGKAMGYIYEIWVI